MANPKPKPDDEKQSKRFIEKANEAFGEEAESVFREAFIKILPPKKKEESNS